MDATSLVRAHSTAGASAAAADDEGHHALRRMFSSSVIGSLLRRDVGTLSLADVALILDSS